MDMSPEVTVFMKNDAPIVVVECSVNRPRTYRMERHVLPTSTIRSHSHQLPGGPMTTIFDSSESITTASCTKVDCGRTILTITHHVSGSEYALFL